ncbi:calcium-binding and coiled-coil domain-containing protein 2 isoform X2 [Xiphias gladius]|uniref:calcium-binding and coiled-coil domain-containing protein 2 isoform X2 n=1 Tax=Xiphias gladius TaxID=8245 RepID=UPI001A97DFDA|nr:calcium-binding and coiled-coil domain-containing protein 2 isoform X2 [Xiphias gladius]
MESPSEAPAAADPSACTYSQVVFVDIPHSYPPSAPVTCRYTLNPAYEPNPRDWVGIFRVGWSSAKDYHTFVWAEPCLEVAGRKSVTSQAVFDDYYLPKDEMEFYQFCYIDSTGQVRGASTPFCFKNPVEQSMESSSDDDLLVITTQEQVEQSVREKAELRKELDRLKEENETLQNALQKEQLEAAISKVQNEQKEKEKIQLLRELDQSKEHIGNLKSTLQQQLQEMESLKEELLVQATKLMQIQQRAEQSKLCESLSVDGASSQNETHAQEKYSQAVTKINQLKEEREELKGRSDAQSEEIAMLKGKLRQAERELLKTKDSIQLLQVDLQSSEKEKEKLSAELHRLENVERDMDEVKRQNQELSRRLLEQETRQDFQDNDLRVQCQTLASQLQAAQVKLSAEREKSTDAKRRAESLDRELLHFREQLETLSTLLDQEQRKSGKFELQLREALEAIADRDTIIEEKEHVTRLVKHEHEELTRENQTLRSDVEGLRRAYSDLHAARPADSPHAQPGAASPAGSPSAGREWQRQATPDQDDDDLYEAIGSVEEPEEEALVCRHCQECFPGITQDELEQHEHSHRVCPFCTMICDNMEQSAFEDHVYGHEV